MPPIVSDSPPSFQQDNRNIHKDAASDANVLPGVLYIIGNAQSESLHLFEHILQAYLDRNASGTADDPSASPLGTAGLPPQPPNVLLAELLKTCVIRHNDGHLRVLVQACNRVQAEHNPGAWQALCTLRRCG